VDRVGRGRSPWWSAPLAAALLTASAGAVERLSVPAGDSPILGQPSAPVTVVEFVDYQ